MTNEQILKLENKILAMKKDGKYLQSFLFIFGSTKNFSTKSEGSQKVALNYLTKKGY